MRTVTCTHETLVSLEMKNASLGFDPIKEAAGGEPLELNRPICTAASSFLESTNRFWIAKHFWSIYFTLTEQLYDLCSPFILAEPIDFYWTALIQHEMKNWVTLQAQRGEGEWMDADGVYSPPALLVYRHPCTPYWSPECIIYNQSLLHAEQRDIKAKGKPQRDYPFLSQ